MRRGLFALCGVAAAFALLVAWLGLPGVWVAAVFFGVLAAGFSVLRCYCCRHNRWEPWRLMLFGALAGIPVALPFVPASMTATPNYGFLLLILMPAGAFYGLLFWLAAVWGNRDLTCPKFFCLPCGTIYRAALDALRAQSK